MQLKNPFPALPPAEGPPWREYAILGLLLSAVFLACFKPLSDPDTYWHLALGREIWQTGQLVQTETFSFTKAGTPWPDTEWLFHTFLYPVWKATGDMGLQIATALAGVLGLGLAYRCVRIMGGSASAMAIFLLPTLPAYAARVRCRPDAVSILLMAVLCELLFRWHRRLPEASPYRWWIAGLFFLWVQVHGAWIYGLVLLWAFIAGALLDAWRGRHLCADGAEGLLAPGLASLAVLFFNPYGWLLPAFPFKALGSFSDPSFVGISEWSRTPFTGIYGAFSVAVLGTLAGVLLVRRRFSWSEFLPAASQVALGLYWVRYGAFAVVALSGSASSRLALLRNSPSMRRVFPVAGALCAGGLLLAQLPAVFNRPNLSERYPMQECAFIKRHLAGGHLFHEFRVGGYMEWALPSEFKTLMDGRLLFANTVAPEYVKAHRTPEAFASFLKKFPTDVALYPYPEFQLVAPGGGPPRGPSAILFPREDWALCHLGPYGMVFLKREGRNNPTIKDCEYTTLRPDDLAYLLWATGAGKVSPVVLADDIRRALADDCPAGLQGAFRAALVRLNPREGSGRAS